jgi:imidazolonepropionase-like amidohydrolase
VDDGRRLALTGIRVIDGTGAPPSDRQTALVEGDRIAAVGPAAAVPVPPRAQVIAGAGMTLLPGFVDTHVHLGLVRPVDVLLGGVTTVRDLGWPAAELRDLEAAARQPGRSPRLRFAGQILTAFGGYPTRAAWGRPGLAREVADDEDAGRAVAEMAEAGASVVKVALDPRVGPTFEPAVLRAVVRAAERRGLVVTAHVATARELDKAIDCGVAELAHWPFLTRPIDAGLVARAARHLTVVPTLHIEPTRARRSSFAAFVAAGGRVVYGTDMGNQGPPAGIDVAELRLMAAAGIGALDCIAAATARAAGHIGVAGIGVVAAGSAADLVVIEGDPVADLGLLARPRLVVQGGRVLAETPRVRETHGRPWAGN